MNPSRLTDLHSIKVGSRGGESKQGHAVDPSPKQGVQYVSLDITISIKCVIRLSILTYHSNGVYALYCMLLHSEDSPPVLHWK